MSRSLNPRTKTILVNCAVAVALLYERWKGAPLVVVLTVGVFMFSLVDVVMMLAARKTASSTKS